MSPLASSLFDMFRLRAVHITSFVLTAIMLTGCSWLSESANSDSNDNERPVATAANTQAEENPALVQSEGQVVRSDRPDGQGLTGAQGVEYQDSIRPESISTETAFTAPQPSEIQVAVTEPSEPTENIQRPEVPSVTSSQPVEEFVSNPVTQPETGTFTTGSFNQLPPVLNNQGAQTVVISDAGVRHSNITPVSTMPRFSPSVNGLANQTGPITISSRGINYSINQNQIGTSSLSAGSLTPVRVSSDASRVALIYFNSGSVEVDSRSQAALRAFADQYRQSGGVVRIVGHASQRTRDMTYKNHVQLNFNISLGRAQNVGQELVKMGVPAESILLEAKGSSQPEFLEIMPLGEARNRRVELFIEQG